MDFYNRGQAPRGSVRQTKILAEQVKRLYAGMPLSLAVTCVNAIILAVVQSSVIKTAIVLAWLSGILLITGLRGWQTYVFNRTKHGGADIEDWSRRFQVGTIFAGLAWGSSNILLFPAQNIAHQAFLAFVLAGMTAGAVTTLSASWVSALCFLVFCLLPLALQFIVAGEAITMAMGVMVSLFLVGVAVSAWRTHNNILENIIFRIDGAPREEALKQNIYALERLHEITTEKGLSLDEKLCRLLKLGVDIFGLPQGVLSRIEENRYLIEYIIGPEGAPEPGTTYELNETIFCVYTLSKNGPTSFHELGQSELCRHSCDQKFQLGAYIGAPVIVDGEGYGTLNFSDHQPRLAPFSDAEHSLIQLIAHWIGREISQNRDEQKLKRFKNILDHTRDMVFMFEPDTLRFVYLNEGAVSNMGYSREDLLQMTPRVIKSIISESGFRKFIEPLRSQEQSSLSYEDTFYRKNGQEFTADVFLQFVREEGENGLFVAIVRDITERKGREQSLKQQHALLNIISRTQSRYIRDADSRGLFDHLLKDILSLTESEYGFIDEVMFNQDNQPYLKTHAPTNITWNDKTRQLYDQSAVPGMGLHNMRAQFKAAISSGKPVIVNDFKNVSRCGGLPEGHPELDSFLGVPIYNGEKMVCMVGIANRAGGYDDKLVRFLKPLLSTFAHIVEVRRNNQQRMLAEEEIRKSSARIRAIVSTVVDGIITINSEGVVDSFNPAAERIFGYDAHEFVGRKMKMLMSEPERSRHEHYLENYKTTGFSSIMGTGRELEGLRKDGSTFPLELTVSEMQIGDQRMFTGILRDVTDRKKIEKLKSEFISTVSHELRTPLTSIRGSLGLIAGDALGDLPEQVRTLIEIAKKNSERLIYLINDLLDMEKIASGDLIFHFRVRPLMPLVEQAIEANVGYATQFGVSIALTGTFTGTLTDVNVSVDADRLRQVIANLLSNAVKFSPAGDRVEVEVTRRGEIVELAVSDHGSGIPDEFHASIFQTFSQVDASDTRRNGGTGLGLSISKTLIEKMDGRIKFETQLNVGTTFYIELPVWHG